ncbi:hypothetical protein RUM43_002412 [Polyplax serrata]|uniref:Uncharacterized protein n=1 Tax=Polyplax serrata TaxID=468196 RepID=A0AAN8S4Q9_POLSC
MAERKEVVVTSRKVTMAQEQRSFSCGDDDGDDGGRTTGTLAQVLFSDRKLKGIISCQFWSGRRRKVRIF